ncbi:MAG: 5-formyltetrahydrofolate cyclo-ligase [Verrucomicrobiota bacterium]
MTKEELRQQARARLKMLTPTQRFEAAVSAANHLIRSERWSSARVLMLYAALPSELDTFPLLEAAWHAGKSVCLPRLTEMKSEMEIRFLTTINHLKANKIGIMEPDPDFCPIMELNQLDLIIVPGLAFDRLGNRLGKGAGYYDHFLALPQRHAPAIGYFFSCQEFSSIPITENDQPLDDIITENEIIGLKNSVL